MRGSDWTVVGVFASGDAYESELWADVDVAQSTFNRQGYSAVRLQLADAGGLQAVKDALSADPRVNVDVETEQQYFSGQTEQFRRRSARWRSSSRSSWRSARSSRRSTRCTPRSARARARSRRCARSASAALPVVVSIMLESLILALVGGLLGALAAYVLFNNMAVSTLGANFTQVVFQLRGHARARRRRPRSSPSRSAWSAASCRHCAPRACR